MAKVTHEKAYRISVAVDERRSEVFCYSETESLGLELSRGKGWYGGSGFASNTPVDVINIEMDDGKKLSFLVSDAIKVYHVRDYKEVMQEEARQKVLAKLTDAELKVLGLTR